MQNDVLDSLEDLGYNGPLLEEQSLSEALEGGPKSVAYTQLVEWIVSQLASFCNIDEKVSAIQGPDDAEHFLMELSGFLREFSCPYANLVEGPIEGRLSSGKACLQLLDYLLTELASVKMMAVKRPAVLAAMSKREGKVAELSESDVARHLKLMLLALSFSKPPPDITSFGLFSKVESKLRELMSKYPGQAGESLLKSRLSPDQWSNVMAINDVLAEEYKVRREMLIKRLDVTIQSFKWSDKAKHNENKIAEVYQPIRKLMVAKTNVGIPEILAARDDLTRLQKTSSGEARERTKCAINKVLIGMVPDRGGRAWELEPPPPEMPSFMKRDAGPAGGRGGGRGGGGFQGGSDRGGRGGGVFQGGSDRGGRGGGRGGRGGRVQGGWGDNQQQAGNVGGNWSQGGGGYNQGGGYQQGGYQQHGGYQQGGHQQGGAYGGNYQGQGGGNYQGQGGGYQGGQGGGYQGGQGYSGRGGQGGGYDHGGGHQGRGRGRGGRRGRY